MGLSEIYSKLMEKMDGQLTPTIFPGAQVVNHCIRKSKKKNHSTRIKADSYIGCWVSLTESRFCLVLKFGFNVNLPGLV